MIGLFLLLPFFFSSHAETVVRDHSCNTSYRVDGWCEPTPGPQRDCGLRRVWDHICSPVCGVPNWETAEGLTDRQHECMYLCGGNTETPYEREVSLSIWRVGLSDKCIEEMKAGWKPPEWLMVKVKAMLMYVSASQYERADKEKK